MFQIGICIQLKIRYNDYQRLVLKFLNKNSILKINLRFENRLLEHFDDYNGNLLSRVIYLDGRTVNYRQEYDKSRFRKFRFTESWAGV